MHACPSQTINHYITYSVITSQPEISYTSVLSTIRCYAITSGELEGSTFIEWSGHFSSDADASEFLLASSLPNIPEVSTVANSVDLQPSSRTPSSSAAMPSPTSPRLLERTKYFVCLEGNMDF